MRIGLIDIDGHSGFPNLALMKLSAWHKAHGDDVEWYQPLFAIEPFDTVYMSKVFTFTPDYQYPINANKIVRGGTGYKMYDADLPPEIEYTFPDYSIYPQVDYAVGFLTRGCIRKCPWCVVPRKEGWIHAVNTWQKLKRSESRDIILMDNNILASDHGLSQIESMIGQKVRIDINQAMDARLITPEIARMLSKVKWIKSTLRLACDSPQMIPIVEQAVAYLKEAGVNPRRIFVYALVQDVNEAYKRIVALDSMGVDPFAQPYRDFDGGEPTSDQKRLARWCNMKAVHKTVKWEDYQKAKMEVQE